MGETKVEERLKLRMDRAGIDCAPKLICFFFIIILLNERVKEPKYKILKPILLYTFRN